MTWPTLTYSQRSLLSLLMAAPFFVANALVVQGYAPLLAFLRPDGQTSSGEIALLIILLLAVFFGGLVALVPLLQKQALRWPGFVVPLLIGVTLVLLSSLLFYMLLGEMYRCAFLSIPNCD